jgi:hypothetical protein
MCTVAIALRCIPGLDLLVVANRDEQLDRPGTPPQRVRLGDRTALSPRDLRAGGTWIGVNDRDVVAAVTNRWLPPSGPGGGPSPGSRNGEPLPDPARRSRGTLVDTALSSASAREAAARLADADPTGWNPFHLVVADRRFAAVFVSDGWSFRVESMDAGVLAVTERSYGATDAKREALVHDAVSGWLTEPNDDAITALLGHHGEPPFDGACVHAPAYRYGTRSAIHIAVGRRRRYRHAEGPPCTTAFSDFSEDWP